MKALRNVDDLFFFSFSSLSSISPSTTQGDLNNSAMPCIEFKFSNNNNSILTSNLSFGTKYPVNVESEASSALNSLVSTNAPLQTTLVSVKAQKTISVLFFYCPSWMRKSFLLRCSFWLPFNYRYENTRKNDSIRIKHQDSKLLFDLKTSWCCVNKSKTFYLLAFLTLILKRRWRVVHMLCQRELRRLKALFSVLRRKKKPLKLMKCCDQGIKKRNSQSDWKPKPKIDLEDRCLVLSQTQSILVCGFWKDQIENLKV